MLIPQLYRTLFDPLDHSPPGSSVHGILQARLLEWVAISFARGSSQPRDQTLVSWIAGRFFTIWATRKAPQVVQWLRIHLPMQGTQVQSLVWKDPMYHVTTKPVHHNYWAERWNYWSPSALEPVLRNRRVAPTCCNKRKPAHISEDPMQPKINK